MESSSDLDSSELGTKEYWTAVYDREKKNFKDYGDPGEIWFGEDSEQRILRWMEKVKMPKDKSIVDLGCGNGMMLIEMRNEGFTNLTGIDYCENAIELSKSVASSQGIDDIDFKVVDITKSTDELRGFDVALDKGTYDAISLNPDNSLDKRKKYIENVAKMLNQDGLLVITSCNWTEDEIGAHFNDVFEFVELIPTPTFKFGGKIGSIVSSLVLKKKTNS